MAPDPTAVLVVVDAESAVATLTLNQPAALNALTVAMKAELLAAFRRVERDPSVRAVSFVQPGPEHALQAGVWRRHARRKGRTLSLSDALIAAAADGLGAVVLTRNLRDFALTPVVARAY